MTAQQFFVSHLLANAILYSKSLGQLYCYPAPDKAAAGLIFYVFGITQFCQVYAIATYVEKTWICKVNIHGYENTGIGILCYMTVLNIRYTFCLAYISINAYTMLPKF